MMGISISSCLIITLETANQHGVQKGNALSILSASRLAGNGMAFGCRQVRTPTRATTEFQFSGVMFFVLYKLFLVILDLGIFYRYVMISVFTIIAIAVVFIKAIVIINILIVNTVIFIIIVTISSIIVIIINNNDKNNNNSNNNNATIIFKNVHLCT